MSPIILLPLVVIWSALMSVVIGGLGADSGSFFERMYGGAMLGLMACIYAVVIGYLFVGVVFGSRKILQGFGVIREK